MIYLYAFTERALPEQAGLDGEPVRLVTEGHVAAVVGTIDQPPSADPPSLWRHEEVVEALPDGTAVLPVRFGTVVEDEAAVVELLRRHGAVLAAGLARVRGQVEVGVRIRPLRAPRREPVPAGESGRDYLLRRRAEVHDLAEAAEGVHRDLASLARAAVRRRGDGQRQLLIGAYLVPREGIDAFTGALRALPVAEHGLQLVSTGPWPPYHFVPVLEGLTGA